MTSETITGDGRTSSSAYRAFITDDPHWIREAQRLRWIVFSQEYGDQFTSPTPGLDADRYDAHCQHIIVLDEKSDEVVGTYRILGPEGAAAAGSHFADQHFDLSGLLASIDPARLAILGRTCTHPEHRNGTVMSIMWAELGRYAAQSRIRWFGGCLSIPLVDEGIEAAATWRIVSRRYMSEEYKVRPLIPWLGENVDLSGQSKPLPPLLRGYFRAGARVCGEPAHDVGFPCVDLFVFIDLNHADARYLRRYQAS